MKGKSLFGYLVILLSMVLVLSACGSEEQKEPQDALIQAYNNLAEADSYDFESTMTLDMELNEGMISDPDLNMMASMFSSPTIRVSGQYQQDPMAVVMDVNLILEGDMSIQLDIPMVVNEEAMWFKIPSTPFFPVPNELEDKFVKIDLEELQQDMEQDTSVNEIDSFTEEEIQLLGKEVTEIALAAFDPDVFFSTESREDVTIPEEITANNIVQFEIMDENFEESLDTLLFDVVPSVLNFIAEQEWEKFDTDIFEEAINDFEQERSNLEENLEEILEDIRINEIKFIVAIDNKDYPEYQSFNFDFSSRDASDEFQRMSVFYDYSLTNINSADISITLPSDDESIDLDDAMELLFGEIMF